MEITCSACRHVVEVEEGGTAKCSNCGHIYRPPRPAPQPLDPSGAHQDGAVDPGGREVQSGGQAAQHGVNPNDPLHYELPSVPFTKPASTISLVLGLFLFIPFVTQVAAIVLSSVAILRKREENERVTAAWFGMILGILGLLGWGIGTAYMASTGWTAVPAFTTAGGYTAINEDGLVVGDWRDEMLAVYSAARSYHRDYKEWPAKVDLLRDTYLHSSFVLSSSLRFHAIPEGCEPDGSWILLSSAKSDYGLDLEHLPEAHRLVVNLTGGDDLLPSSKVEEMLRSQAECGKNAP